MDKIDKLLNYVIQEEEKYYGFAAKAFERGNYLANQLHTAEATAFQRVRYAIEQLAEED